MDTSIFSDLGLTKAQIAVYLALLELGETKIGRVIEKSGLQSSVVHNTVNTLTEKGLIKYIKKGKIKHYTAASPNAFLHFIDQQKEKLENKKATFEKLLPQLLAKQQHHEKEEAEVYEGWKATKFMYYDLIADANPGEDYLYFAVQPTPNELLDQAYDFFAAYEKERVRKGVAIKGINNVKNRSQYKNRNATNIVFVDFPTPVGVIIFRNTVIFSPWDMKVINFKIQSHQLAESFRILFYSIWDRYKK